jgi:LacI family transcriptional regulator
MIRKNGSAKQSRKRDRATGVAAMKLAAPKHRAIFDRLQADIVAGKYGQGARLPSESQLVRQFGVSRPTAARALRDLQAAGLVERRAGAGSFACDKSVLPVANSRLLGLLIPGHRHTEIFQPMCGAIAELARAADYNVLWGGSIHPRIDADIKSGEAEEICQQFIERNLSGVFFAPFLGRSEDTINRHVCDRFRKSGIPVVLLDREMLPFPSRSDFDLVSTDNLAGGFILTEHLIKLGCKRIGFQANSSVPSVDARLAGYREAYIRNRLPYESDWISYGNVADVQFVRSFVSTSRLDGMICANDQTAAQLLRSLALSGMKVPGEIRVAGFDDVNHATRLSVPLTTIHQPCRELGELAFRCMLERIANPTLIARTLYLTPRLVVRESCGAYLQRKRV